jgi:hypothetical protein
VKGLFRSIAMLAAASLGSALAAAPAYLPQGLEIAASSTTRRRAAIGLARSQRRRFPSKGKAGRPAKHRNLNHVSRRVRRKHRRGRA